MKKFINSLFLCLVSTLAYSGIQANNTVINWMELNQFEYHSHHDKQNIVIEMDAAQGLVSYQLAGEIKQQHHFKPADVLLPKRLSQHLNFPYYNITESDILLKNACGGRRAIFDRTMATYVNALRNGASQDTLNALASAVWNAFSEWMFCMIR